MVSGEPLLAHQPETRLVPVARSCARWRATQQLAEQFRRSWVDQGWQPVLLPFVSQAAAGCELAQPGSARGDAQRASLLAGPWGRRVSRGRDVDDDQGRSVSRQPGQSLDLLG